MPLLNRVLPFLAAAGLAGLSAALADSPEALRINGPSVYGVRTGTPVLYRIPVVGPHPRHIACGHLPPGLALDPDTGILSGTSLAPGTYLLSLTVTHGDQTAQRGLKLEVGDRIGLTPAMGWNSWNCWAAAVDADKVRRAARAMVASGLADHGWSYVNIDDTWQGRRDARSHALQPNAKFGDLGALASEVHGLGLKIGIYSTPWITSYAGLPGGSSDQPGGDWDDSLKPFEKGRRFGRYSFAQADTRQWAAWGIDYLKYDWRPNDLPHVREMSEALAHSGRSIIYSLSNAAPLGEAASWAQYANSWRTTGDIRDVWSEDLPNRRYFGVSEIGFAQDPWAAFAGPGHFNDPDMLVLGFVGWKAELHPTRLTPDEQQTHFSLWCLLSAPLLLGCDLERLDPATLALITNDEVLALDQDALGQQAVRMATDGAIDVYLKRLENGGWALGFFNRQNASVDYTFGKLNRIGLSGRYHLRDPWRHRDLPGISDTSAALLPMQLTAHGVQLYVLNPSS